jgi:plastocyanin
MARSTGIRLLAGVSLGISVIIGSLALHGCGSGGGGTSNLPAVTTINAKNDAAAPMGFSFDSPVTVSKGTAVQWSNISTAPHGIIWDAQSPASSPAPGANIPNFGPGTTSASWTAPNVTVATAYNYHCSVHGPTMAGVINVTP